MRKRGSTGGFLGENRSEDVWIFDIPLNRKEAFREKLSTWLDRNMAEVFGDGRDPLAHSCRSA